MLWVVVFLILLVAILGELVGPARTVQQEREYLGVGSLGNDVADVGVGEEHYSVHDMHIAVLHLMVGRDDQCVAVDTGHGFAVDRVKVERHVAVIGIGDRHGTLVEVGYAVGFTVFAVQDAAPNNALRRRVVHLLYGEVGLIVDGVEQVVHGLVGGREDGVVAARREQVAKCRLGAAAQLHLLEQIGVHLRGVIVLQIACDHVSGERVQVGVVDIVAARVDAGQCEAQRQRAYQAS